MNTHYAALGVLETATQSEIKAAYRSLLKKIHPDTASTLSMDLRHTAEDVTKEIIDAYSVLSDAGKRREYDRQLAGYRQPPPSLPLLHQRNQCGLSTPPDTLAAVSPGRGELVISYTVRLGSNFGPRPIRRSLPSYS